MAEHKFKVGAAVKIVALDNQYYGEELYVLRHTYGLKGERLYVLGSKTDRHLADFVQDYCCPSDVPEEDIMDLWVYNALEFVKLVLYVMAFILAFTAALIVMGVADVFR